MSRAQTLPPSAFRTAPAPAGHPLHLLAHALDVWRERRALARLDDTALHDLGLTRADAVAESRRPLWSLPRL